MTSRTTFAAWRDELGLSIEEAAELLGLGRGQVCALLRGYDASGKPILPKNDTRLLMSAANAGVPLRPWQLSEHVKEILGRFGMDMGKYYHNREDFRKFGGAGVAKYIKSAMHFDVSALVPQFNAIAADPFLSSNAENLRSSMVEAINKSLGLDPNDKKTQGDLAFHMGEMLRKTYANMDFLSFIKDLANTGAYRDQELMSKLAGVFQMPKLMDLVMKQLSGDFDERLQQYFHKMTGATRTHLEIWNEGIVGAVKKMVGLWDYMTDKLFDASGLNKSLNQLAKTFLDFSDNLKALDPKLLWNLGAGLMGLTAATGVGLVLMGVSAAMATLLNPVTLLAGSLAYFGYQLYANQDSIQAWWNGISTVGQLLAGGGALVAGLVAIRYALIGVRIAFMASPFGWIARLIGLGILVYENWSKVVAVFERLKAVWNDSALKHNFDSIGEWFKGQQFAPAQQGSGLDLPGLEQEMGRNRETIGLWMERARRGEHVWGGSKSEMINSNNTNNVSVSVNVQSPTAAPAAVGRAVARSITETMNSSLHDLPQQ